MTIPMHVEPVEFLTFRKRLIAGVLMINLLIIGLTCYSLYSSWQQYLKRIETTSENLARALELSIDGIFDKINIALLAVKYEAERELVNGGITLPAINDCIAKQRGNITEIDNLRIADAKGDILYGVFQKSVAPANIADREYFIKLRDNPQAGLFIAKPLFGRVSNKWIIIIARRVNNPDGSFAGVVHGNISLDFFLKHFASFSLGNHDVITLRDSDLGLIARNPEAKGIGIGNRTVSKEFSQLIQKGHDSGTYTNPGSIDAVQRIFSYRKITDYPLYIIVGLAIADYRKEWLHNSLKMLSLAACIAVVTLISSRIVVRKWEQGRKANEELSQYRLHLETLVSQRTEELSLKQQQLTKLNEELNYRIADEVAQNRKKDQILLHQDKMSSIGQLAARVAHEINNPLAFIASNLATLKGYVETLERFYSFLLGLVEKNCSGEELHMLREATLKQDITFILEDIGPLIDESSEGADRVKRIVHDLKDFARMEDGNFELVDLNDCVRSTINIVRNEIKYVADLDLKLGEIPPVNCSRHQISQVIINLLVNAAHSIRNHGSIIVSTYRENGHVVLKVSDTGHGMPEEVRKRVFDPFFTTKEVGEGTGLGLSISYSIVKKHGGEITVESGEGVGSAFTITLPINEQQEVLT
jgi:two-component system NtrC family sensor kinase